MEAGDRHTIDDIDAQRVLANVSEGLFGLELAQAKVGRFVLLDQLGAGGMGVVYAAFDPQLDRKVAIKVLHHGAQEEDEMAAARLLREARALAKLSHPNVVTVFEVGTVQGRVFLAMEMTVGKPVDEWLQARPSWQEIVGVFREAGKGLAAAHAAGIVHRDFKPSNVVLGDDGRVTVLDFGLARAEDAGTEAVPEDTELGRLTRTNVVAGTPIYMAPEQLMGQAVTAASDQFSFCVSLFEALYGVRPFPAKNITELIAKVLAGEITEPDVDSSPPAWLKALARRGLSVDPKERFPSMDALLATLKGPSRPRWHRPALALGAVSVGVAAFALSGGTNECTGAQDKVSAVWSAARRAEVESAFAATEKSYSADASRSSVDALDAYAGRWVEAHYEACAATRIRGEQSEDLLDRRMVCLQHRLDALDTLAGLFSKADPAIVHRAAIASRSLPQVEDCANVEPLLADGPELTPDARQARANARGELARARMVFSAGQRDAARDVIAGVLAEAAGDDPAIRAYAGYLLAAIEEQDGNFEEAESWAKRSLWDAVSEGDAEAQARVASKLVTLVGKQLERFDEGRDWGLMAAAALERLDNPPQRVATLEAELGKLAHAEGEFEEALEHERRALELRQAHIEPDDPRIAHSHDGVGYALSSLGRSSEALEHHQEAIQIREAVLGPTHPSTGQSYNLLASRLISIGRTDEGIAALNKARDIWRESLGADNYKIGIIENNLGNALGGSDEAELAIPHYRAAIRIWTATRGADARLVATPYSNLGAVLLGLGKTEEGLEAELEAFRISALHLGEDHPGWDTIRINLSWAYADLGRFGEALEHATLAEETILKHRGETHPFYPGATIRVAHALRGLGRGEEALAAAERAAKTYAEIDARAGDRYDAYFLLAQLLREVRNDTARARQYAVRARDEALGAPLPQKDRVAEVEQWLATLQ